jgi:PiT family inorganic phosphate transporter
MSQIVNLLALIASIFMGVSIGASSVAPAFGPVNSSGSTNVLRAALLAGVFALIGSIVQGQNVADTVGSGILMGELELVQGALILFVASALVIISVLTDYPMPTAFTVVGAVLGSALSFSNAIDFAVMQKILLYWVGIPFVALGLSYLVAKLLRKTIPEEGSEKITRYLLLISGSYMAYTAGAGSVGLAVGPLATMNISSYVLLWIGGLSILAGAWLYSPRIIRAVSFDYSNIGPRRSIAALSTAAVLAQIGIFYGVPISFNEAIIASVIGSGLVKGKSNVDKKKIGYTIGAWIGAFVLAAVLTFIAGMIITSFF